MKKCSSCKVSKTRNEFNKNSSKCDNLQSMCRACNKKTAKNYYAKNKSHHRLVCSQIKKRRIRENQNKLFEVLRRSECVDCAERDPLVLEFDHVQKKDHGISELLCGGYSWHRIFAEMKKCEIRCANCHNKKTHQANNSYRWRLLVELKSCTSH